MTFPVERAGDDYHGNVGQTAIPSVSLEKLEILDRYQSLREFAIRGRARSYGISVSIIFLYLAWSTYRRCGGKNVRVP